MRAIMAPTTDTTPARTETSEASAPSSAPILVDLGKHGRKRVRQLREGRGPLMEEIAHCVAELQSGGAIAANTTPVVIIVRERRRRQAAWPLA